MNESQRKRIEEAANAYARRGVPRFGISYSDINAFIAGAEFAMKMIESDETEVSNLREAEWQRERDSSGV